MRAWPGLVIAIPLIATLAGCVSKAKASAQARAAFLAGQQQAARQFQYQGPIVTIVGQVKNTVIPWTAELTLAKALLAADYFGATDPSAIVVHRSGEEVRVDPKNLFAGSDLQLQPRDVVELLQ